MCGSETCLFKCCQSSLMLLVADFETDPNQGLKRISKISAPKMKFDVKSELYSLVFQLWFSWSFGKMKSMETWWSESHGMYMHLFIHFPQLPGPGRWFFTYSYLYHPGTWGSERSIRPPRFFVVLGSGDGKQCVFFLTDILLNFFSRKILQPESFLWGESSLESIKEILPRFIYFPKTSQRWNIVLAHMKLTYFEGLTNIFPLRGLRTPFLPGFFGRFWTQMTLQLRCRKNRCKNGAGRRGASNGVWIGLRWFFFVLVVVISRTTWFKKMNIHFCWCCLCELFIFVGVLTARFRMSVVFRWKSGGYPNKRHEK